MKPSIIVRSQDRRPGGAVSVSEAFPGVLDESVESTELAPTINGFHLEPRCRICRNDQVRTKVNDLLATGASYAMVLRTLGDDNAKLEQGGPLDMGEGIRGGYTDPRFAPIWGGPIEMAPPGRWGSHMINGNAMNPDGNCTFSEAFARRGIGC
jgi:hypothetical protein